MKRRSLVFTPLLALAALLILAACGGSAPITVSIDAPTTTIAIDGRTQLSATVTGTSNTAVTWQPSDPSIATVDSNGIVEANGVAGVVTITATSVADSTVSDSVQITVGTFSITGVTISAPATSVAVGDTLDLDATVSPAGVPQEIIWSSGSTGVATIDSDGVVTGVAAGTSVITARAAADTDASATIVITVFASGGGGNVTSVTINDPIPSGPDQVQVGGTLDLTVDVVADPGVSQAVTWSSGDDSTATVDGNGLVTGVAGGSVTITATSVADPTVSDDISIEVLTGSVTGVTITGRPSGDRVFVGDSFDLDATVNGTGNFGQQVIWASSAPGVATIDADGMVDAVAEGTTTITAVAASDTNFDASFVLTVAEASVSCDSPTPLTDISTDTNLALGCYDVNQFEVDISAAVTIAPGSIIRFQAGSRLDIEAGGSLTADGTPTEPITFTGQGEVSGFWNAIRNFSAIPSTFDNVVVEYAGAGSYDAIEVGSSGRLALTNSTVRDNENYGLSVAGGGELTAFSANAFARNGVPAIISPEHLGQLDGDTDFGVGNGDNVIEVRGGDTDGDTTWVATNVPYLFSGFELDVNDAITIEDGFTMLFDGGNRLDINSGGSVTANGAADGIVLRGETQTAGYWTGVRIFSSVPSSFDGVTFGDGIENVRLQGIASFANSTFANASSYGLFAETSGTINGFASNTFSENAVAALVHPLHLVSLDGASTYGSGNTANVVDVDSGDTTTAGTWPAIDVPYRFVGFELDVNHAITVEDGFTMQFQSGTRMDVNSTGSLTVEGDTAGVVFTGTSNTPGHWRGIRLYSSGNSFTNTTVSYGGGTDANVDVNGGQLDVTGGSYTNSGTRGLYVRSNAVGTSTITDATFADNSGLGLEAFSGDVNPNVCSVNTFTNNGDDGSGNECVVN